jgi:predicted metal-dependent peptidase
MLRGGLLFMRQIDIRKELVKAIVGVAREKEFYGHVIQQFEKVYVGDGHAVSTAAVGRQKGERFIKLYLNEGFFRNVWETESGKNGENPQKAAQKLSGIIEHEILHVVVGHLTLVLPDKTRRAIAVDCVVNQLISSERRPSGCVMPERYGMPADMTAVWYYNALKGNGQFDKDCRDGVFGIGGVMDWALSSHGLWEDVSEDAVLKELIRDIVRKAKDVTSVQGWGDLSSGVVEAINGLLEKKPSVVPWQKVLRTFCASVADDFLDYTQKRESRRFGVRPGTKKGDTLNLAVAIDTSGSISNQQLQKFMNEIRWIWKNGAEVTVFEADARVVRSYRFRGKFDGEVHGRGGTNLEPALEAAEKGRFDGLIYFTDFQAPKIARRYKINVLWLLSEELQKSYWPCDWGRVIQMVKKEAA